MKCIRCGKEAPDGALYCPWCGKRQPENAPPAQRKKRRRPKGSGTVYKLSGTRAKPYAAIVPDKDKKRVVLGTYASAGEAVQALDTYNAQRTPASRLRSTFKDVYKKWSASHFADIGDDTRDGYMRAYKNSKKLWDIEMRDLKTEDYQSVVDGLVKSGKSRSYCEKQRGLFSQLCQYAMQQDIINKNYAEGLNLPPLPPKKERTLDADEVAKIRSVADDTGKNNKMRLTAQIAMVLLYTGMRIDELLKMKRDDVDLQKSYMVGGEKTETGKGRTIPILEPIKYILAEWMLLSIGNEYLLSTHSGKKKDVNNVETSFRKLMLALGINKKDTPKQDRVTPHTLRRTAATIMVESDVVPTATKSILGHKNYSTTANFYTAHRAKYLMKEMKKAEKNFEDDSYCDDEEMLHK